MMRPPLLIVLAFCCLLSSLPIATAQDEASLPGARNANSGAPTAVRYVKGFLSDDPQDPGNQVQRVRARASAPPSALFPDPFRNLHEQGDRFQQNLYDQHGMKTALSFHTVLQQLSDALPGEEKFGMATDTDFVIDWEVLHRGQPDVGRVVFGLEGRWEYGPPGPTDLAGSVGSAITTANAYAAYNPTYIVRNLYWKQGSKELGWAYRVGHITPDQILSTSSRLSPITTFLPVAGTGAFANAIPDSGLGFVTAFAVSDRIRIGGLVSDANANRLRWAIGDGELYKALEIQAKIVPVTEEGVWSKITFWHNDGTSSGQPNNASTGREGWGIFVVHEQELTCDGRLVGVLRWGQSSNRSALYSQQVGAAFVLDDPCVPTLEHLTDDAFGIGFNWSKPSIPGSRDESDFEAFYRLPLFPNTDLSLLYQSIFEPALTRDIDHVSVFSIRLSSSY